MSAWLAFAGRAAWPNATEPRLMGFGLSSAPKSQSRMRRSRRLRSVEVLSSLPPIGVNGLQDNPITRPATDSRDEGAAQLTHITDRFAGAGNERAGDDPLPHTRRTREPSKPMAAATHDTPALRLGTAERAGNRRTFGLSLITHHSPRSWLGTRNPVSWTAVCFSWANEHFITNPRNLFHASSPCQEFPGSTATIFNPYTRKWLR